jgi:hypothetical protein
VALRKERLPVQVVEHLHRLLGGDARVEAMVLRFIADKYDAPNLLHLPPAVASAIIKRPSAFLQAAKNHCEPELFFGPGNGSGPSLTPDDELSL